MCLTHVHGSLQRIHATKVGACMEICSLLDQINPVHPLGGATKVKQMKEARERGQWLVDVVLVERPNFCAKGSFVCLRMSK